MTATTLRPQAAPPVVPPAPAKEPPAARDVSLDLLRGLAIAILVVNHVPADSALHYATEPFLSAAETLVAVSGVVAGMVFGRRWIALGARATTRMLLRRAFVLYRASVCVVALVGALTLVPGLATDALTILPRTAGPDLYAYDGVLRTALAVVTLEAGPWQFNILGFFIAALALTPLVLWALERGWWPAVLLISWAAFAVGRSTMLDVLPAQSERAFPLLIWQLLFVHGVVVGRHRDRIARAVRRFRRPLAIAVLGAAAVAAYTRLHEVGLDPLGLDALLGFGADDWRRWDYEHFGKATLDGARLATMLAFMGAAYLAFRRFEPQVVRAAGWLLLPLGRNSFFVFIVHVFLCLAVATALGGGGLGLLGNTALQAGVLLLVIAMVRRRLWFRWVPR